MQRQREVERQRAQEEQRRRAYKKAQRRRQIIAAGVLIALAAGVAFSVQVATNDQSTKATSTTTTTKPSTSTSSTIAVNPGPPASIPTPAAGVVLTQPTPCPNADGSSSRTTGFAGAPPQCIDPAKDYQATIHTTKGDLVVMLNQQQAPNTVNNFVTLARYHYYDGAPVTRITPRGWMQFDDIVKNPDGSTGPGYTIPGEAPPKGSIPSPIMIAMVPTKDGSSAGSFLIGIADQAPAVPQTATSFGQVMDDRLDKAQPPENQSTVREVIDKAATKTGQPAEVITITGIDITEQPKK